MIARRAFPYWRRRSWKRSIFRVEQEISWHRRKKRQAVRRSLAERFPSAAYPASVIGPMIASGALLRPPGENEVYVKGSFVDPEAIGFSNTFLPYVVNTPIGWNSVRTEIEQYPLWWTRIR